MIKKFKGSTARIITAIVLTNILLLSVVGILIWLNLFDDLKTDFVFMHVIFSAYGILNTLLILWLFYKVDKKNPWLLGFHYRKKDAFFSIIAIVITLLTVLVFIYMLDKLGIVTAQFEFDRALTGEFYKFLFIAGFGWFFAALKEEVLARGYFFANLSHFSILKIIFISSLLFMALHFIQGDFDPYKAASWFSGGIVYAYIYLKSGSLTVSTIIHAAHNHVNAITIHGSEGAIVLLNTTVTTADKLIYETILGLLLLALTYLFYGNNGWLTPSDQIKKLFGHENHTIEGK